MPPPRKGQGKAKKPNGTQRKAKERPPEDTYQGRPVVHPEVRIVPRFGDNPLSVEDADTLLGWQEETDDNKFGSDFLLLDANGKKIRCTKNVGNRPLYAGVYKDYSQSLLTRRWSGPNGNGETVNGETMVIGKTDTIISAQHRLIALKLAEQIRLKDPAKWLKYWQSPVVMDAILVFGVDESDSVVNTIDIGKTRSETDIIYRCPYFADQSGSERKTRSRILVNATRFLLYRTWADKDAYEPRRTPVVTVDCIERHRRLIQAVNHISEENGDDAISVHCNGDLGRAAGLLYLMGSCDSEMDKYKETPDESALDFARWEKACEFWVLLSKRAKEFHEVRLALAALNDPETGERGSIHEKIAVLIKAWNEFSIDGPLTEKNVSLGDNLKINKLGQRVLVNPPTVGGIDRGPPQADNESTKKAAAEVEDVPTADPTEDEINEKTKEIVKNRPSKTPPQEIPFDVLIKSHHEDNPGKILLYHDQERKKYRAFLGSAQTLSGIFGHKTATHSSGLPVYVIDEVEFKPTIRALQKEGHDVCTVEPNPKDRYAVVITDVASVPQPGKKKTKPVESAEPAVS